LKKKKSKTLKKKLWKKTHEKNYKKPCIPIRRFLQFFSCVFFRNFFLEFSKKISKSKKKNIFQKKKSKTLKKSYGKKTHEKNCKDRRIGIHGFL
jgi:hypothetical protein